MKKIGLLSLALVLALGALGAAYAPWTDEIEIKQVVHTGSLEVGVFGVYDYFEEKDVMDVTLEHGGDLKFRKEVSPLPPGSLILPDVYPFFESVTISINNMYPSIWVREDFYIGVGGTVPVHLYVDVELDDPDGLYDCLTISWRKYLISEGAYTLEAYGEGPATVDGSWEAGALGAMVAAVAGQQVHPCETVLLWVDKHLEQCGGENQGLEGSFTLTVTGYQYNYDPPVGG